MFADETYQDNSLYSQNDDKAIESQRRIDSFFSRIKYFLIQIWPTVYKVTYAIIYFILKTIKSSVKYAIEQIKFGG